MSRLTRCIRLAVLAVAVPAFGQSVTVFVPPPPSVHVIVPAPVVVVPRRVVVVPAPVVVEERVVVVAPVRGNRGKHKGQRK
jgi:hypothetical protein